MISDVRCAVEYLGRDLFCLINPFTANNTHHGGWLKT